MKIVGKNDFFSEIKVKLKKTLFLVKKMMRWPS